MFSVIQKPRVNKVSCILYLLYLDITNILNRYLPAFLYLPGTTHLLRASARELPVPFFTPLVYRGRGSNLRPPDPEADALPLELSGPVVVLVVPVFRSSSGIS